MTDACGRWCNTLRILVSGCSDAPFETFSYAIHHTESDLGGFQCAAMKI